jgi:D-alanyl-D-alanine carboxypeptidase
MLRRNNRTPAPRVRGTAAAAMTAITAVLSVLALVGTVEPAIAHIRRPLLLTDPTRDAALVMDAVSGKVIYARNEVAIRHPASLTKMMTLYLLFEALNQKKLSLQSALAVSPNAAAQPRAHLRLKAGQTITVDAAIRAIVVCSANDAAVTIAEAVGGTEPHFTELMNAKARVLGMPHTFYHNASGLPDDLQLTSAADLAILARHLVYDFPQYFPYFRTPSFSWRGMDFNNHDMLIGNYPGADGIKTGYVDASGYNLVTTAMRGRTRLIAVVLGGITAARRDRAMEELLDGAFAREASTPHGS